MNLARELHAVEPRVVPSPWPGREHFNGYAVMSLPFSSGHHLGLRVFNESDVSPYVSVWHRSPEGDWSIYNDGPSLETTCPRWWGPALERAELTRIRLDWTGPNELRVELDEPRLAWTMTVETPRFRGFINSLSSHLPLSTWKPPLLRKAREWVAKNVFGMGELRFSFVVPTGMRAVIAPLRIYFIGTSSAVLEGRDLGSPVRLTTNPTIGGTPLPTRPTFVIGGAFGRE